MPRLFFALQPGSDACEAIAEAGVDVVRGHGGRAIPAPKIHLTLAFLGNVELDRIAFARAAAQGFAARPFELSVDRIGSFARHSLAWAAPSHVPGELASLHEGLARQLREAGFELERRPFSPHITIARRIERALPPAKIPAIPWSVREFVLVESDLAKGAYRDLARWPLAGSDEGKRAS